MAVIDLPELRGQLDRVVRDLRGNPRARLGLMAIGLLVAAYALVLLDDANDAARRRYADTHLQLVRLKSESAQQDWAVRAKQEAALRATLEQRYWRADTEGLALAQLQDWARGAAQDSGLDRVQVTTDKLATPNLPDGLTALGVTINGTGSGTMAAALLAKVAENAHLLTINHLHVTEAPSARVELQLIAYYQPANPESGKPAVGKPGGAGQQK